MRLGAVAAGALACAFVAADAAAGRRPFTVADSIALTRLLDPNAGLAAFSAPQFKVSPDGTKLIVVTRRGVLERGVNEYSLISFSAAEIAEFVNSGDARRLPKQDALFTLSSFSGNAWYQPAIDQVAWRADGQSIAFVARNGEANGRACLYDLVTRQITTLTAPHDDVASFAVTPDRSSIIYSAYVTPNWDERNRRGYAVGADHLSTLLSTDAVETPARKLHYFVASQSSGSSEDIGLSPGFLSTEIAISPTGRQAVLIARVPTVPIQWHAYNFLSGRLSDIDPPSLYQAMLLELPSHRVRPLLGAPLDPAAIQRPLWAEDGETVYLKSSYLPLDVADRGELARRRLEPASVAVRVDSGTWRRTEAPPVVETRRSVEFSVLQEMNTAPEIIARDSVTRRERVITDFSPPLRNLAIGHAQPFEWEDRSGGKFVGQLVLPSGYIEGKHYPVVLQTRSFNPEKSEFLLDGPIGLTTIYAARALAGQNLIVLQMPNAGGVQDPNAPDREQIAEADRENPRFVAMMEGAIDALLERGLADGERVGLAGFSRAGMNVQYAITFSDYPIAAAIIADAIAATPLSYTARYGEGMTQWEHSSFIGAPFFGPGISKWLERSPIFHLDRIRTPLLYEVHGTKFIPEHWDSFAILKRQGRPVEMVHIPFASHNIDQSVGRFTSQQGSVDWFAYWLSGRVDPDPRKSKQYERWSRMAKEIEEQAAGWETETRYSDPIGASPTRLGPLRTHPVASIGARLATGR